MVELHTFETISEATGGTIDRLSVAGGWLYRTRTWDNRSNSFGTSLAYVPDSGATGGGQPAAAAGTCFWYANLLGINLAPDDEPHTLPIGEGYPFAERANSASVLDGDDDAVAEELDGRLDDV